MSVPERITIVPDNYHAKHAGITTDGRQFFLTTPFVPGAGEYLGLYLWDAAGEFIDATIRDFGPRRLLKRRARVSARDELLASLGQFETAPISVAPFSIEHDGEQFGLVPSEFEGMVTVNALPGDYMAFFEPWDSGEYDT